MKHSILNDLLTLPKIKVPNFIKYFLSESGTEFIIDCDSHDR